MLGKEHGQAFVIADPTGVAVSAVGQVRREQRVKVIIGERSVQWLETDFLQHDVAKRIGEYLLEDPVAPADVGVGQLENWDAGLDRLVLELAVPLLLRKE